MDGIELCARFSYITNKLEYCGPCGCNKLFLELINGNADRKKESFEMMKRFEGLLPYLSVIGKKKNKKPFSFGCTEAYWIGNENLEGFSKRNFIEIINNLEGRGLLKALGEKLKDKIPKKAVPHHTFNVFFVGVGMLTGSVATTIENMDNCRISWGKVMNVKKKKLVVYYNKLKIKNKKLFLGKEELKEVDYDRVFGDFSTGDIVAIHWNSVVMKLTKKQRYNLEKYTLINIKAVNF